MVLLAQWPESSENNNVALRCMIVNFLEPVVALYSALLREAKSRWRTTGVRRFSWIFCVCLVGIVYKVLSLSSVVTGMLPSLNCE